MFWWFSDLLTSIIHWLVEYIRGNHLIDVTTWLTLFILSFFWCFIIQQDYFLLHNHLLQLITALFNSQNSCFCCFIYTQSALSCSDCRQHSATSIIQCILITSSFSCLYFLACIIPAVTTPNLTATVSGNEFYLYLASW